MFYNLPGVSELRVVFMSENTSPWVYVLLVVLIFLFAWNVSYIVQEAEILSTLIRHES